MKVTGLNPALVRVMAVASVLVFLAFSVVFNSTSVSAAPGDEFCIAHPTNPNCIIASLTPTPTATAVGTASATPTSTPHGVQKIRICHSTDSQSNPYTNPNVDQDSADGYSGNDNGQGDHYLEHNGPVWYDGIPNHSWGDIIPPVAADGEKPGHNGKNWNSQGQAIWNNQCNIPADPTATPDPTDPGDVCANIDGVQTSVPSDLHLDASQRNCVSFSVPGADTGTGGGQVLGASTMAGTGAGEDMLAMMFAIGSFSFGVGIRKYTYAFTSSQK